MIKAHELKAKQSLNPRIVKMDGWVCKLFGEKSEPRDVQKGESGFGFFPFSSDYLGFLLGLGDLLSSDILCYLSGLEFGDFPGPVIFRARFSVSEIFLECSGLT